MNNGIYRYEDGVNPYDRGTLFVEATETEKSLRLKIIEKDMLFSTYVNVLFGGKDQVSINKGRSPHAVTYGDGWFVIYPNRAGQPLWFKEYGEKEKQIARIAEVIDNMTEQAAHYYEACEEVEAYADSDNIAEALCAAGYCKREWISVADRLPDEDGKYIVCTAKNSVYCTKYYAGSKNFGANSTSHITHWMPLPEPPKGE